MKIQKNISHLMVSEKTSIFEAIKKISNNDVGALIVAKNKYFLGYLQEGDLKRALLINNVSPSSHIDKIMNKEALVNDISTPIKLSSYKVLIVNCSTGEFILFFFFVKKSHFQTFASQYSQKVIYPSYTT